MGVILIDGLALKKMINGGAGAINGRKSEIDALNVFPVPDGDTGVNMASTILSAAREIETVSGGSACDVAKAASSGALKGARGNSGVILSQLFRGFAKSVETKSAVTTADFALGLKTASETARKAVMKPKEGTILTIASALADKAFEICLKTDDFGDFFKTVLKHGYDVLNKTPDMLPVLKEAGVVDAGGLGLLIFLQGAASAADLADVAELSVPSGLPAAQKADFAKINPQDITFHYCTEFFLNLSGADKTAKAESELLAFLDSVGDSIVVASDGALIKVHVHSNSPGLVLETALKYGYLSNMKIENMALQHTGLLAAGAPEPLPPKKNIAFVASAHGEGLTQMFKDLGADFVVSGGQTNNPSAQDFLDCIKRLNAEAVFILPNNKNVILAAKQAADLSQNENVRVCPTKTVCEGISALMCFFDGITPDELEQSMLRAAKNVKTGEITAAVKDASVGGLKIKKGEILCVEGGKIRFTAQNAEDGALELIGKMVDEKNGESVVIYYGQPVAESAARALADKFSAGFPGCSVEVVRGGQPLYHYIFSVE